ncbi:MAG: PilX N-terminal domain-containing pilus assembly protein, partial [Casimicrobium sp.]
MHATVGRLRRSTKSRSRGFVLVVALLLIVAATLLTLSTMQSGVFQERMGAVDRDHLVAVGAAEAATQDGERDLMSVRSGPRGTPTSDCVAAGGNNCRFLPGDSRRLGASKYQDDRGVGRDFIAFSTPGVRCGRGICDLDALSAVGDTKAWEVANVWTNLTTTSNNGLAVAFGTFTGASAIVDSRGIALIKQPAYIIEQIKTAEDSVLQSLAYRITARGYGTNSRSTALIQSIFVMPPPGSPAAAAGPAVPPPIEGPP